MERASSGSRAAAAADGSSSSSGGGGSSSSSSSTARHRTPASSSTTNNPFLDVSPSSTTSAAAPAKPAVPLMQVHRSSDAGGVRDPSPGDPPADARPVRTSSASISSSTSGSGSGGGGGGSTGGSGPNSASSSIYTPFASLNLQLAAQGSGPQAAQLSAADVAAAVAGDAAAAPPLELRLAARQAAEAMAQPAAREYTAAALTSLRTQPLSGTAAGGPGLAVAAATTSPRSPSPDGSRQHGAGAAPSAFRFGNASPSGRRRSILLGGRRDKDKEKDKEREKEREREWGRDRGGAAGDRHEAAPVPMRMACFLQLVFSELASTLPPRLEPSLGPVRFKVEVSTSSLAVSPKPPRRESSAVANTKPPGRKWSLRAGMRNLGGRLRRTSDGDGREVLHVGSMRLVEKEGRSHQPCYLTLLSDRLEVAAGSKGGRPFMTALVSSMESVSLSNRTRPPPGEDGPYDYDDPPDDEDGVDHDNDSTSDDPPQSMFIVLDDGRVLQFTNSSVSDVEAWVEAVQDLIEEEEDEDAFVPMAASAANSRPSSKRPSVCLPNLSEETDMQTSLLHEIERLKAELQVTTSMLHEARATAAAKAMESKTTAQAPVDTAALRELQNEVEKLKKENAKLRRDRYKGLFGADAADDDNALETEPIASPPAAAASSTQDAPARGAAGPGPSLPPRNQPSGSRQEIVYESLPVQTSASPDGDGKGGTAGEKNGPVYSVPEKKTSPGRPSLVLGGNGGLGESSTDDQPSAPHGARSPRQPASPRPTTHHTSRPAATAASAQAQPQGTDVPPPPPVRTPRTLQGQEGGPRRAARPRGDGGNQRPQATGATAGTSPPRHATGLADLSRYDWFHGPISREESARLVLSQESGSYLVRESSSRGTSCVLTINWMGTPRHLRLEVSNTGVMVNGIRFESVVNLLANFRNTPFPVAQSEGVLRLTSYVPRNQPPFVGEG